MGESAQNAHDVHVCLVVAVAENGVIGRDGKLPWRMPSDLKTFRRMTLGKPVIMGRRTWDSIGKPLDGRDNIVVSRDSGFRPEGAILVRTFKDAIDAARIAARARGESQIMVIGGAEIYRQAMAVADRIYLTRVHAAPEGDATFTEPDPAHWQLIERSPIEASPRDDHGATLLVYQRIGR
jgi:dihydrofolate reductase